MTQHTLGEATGDTKLGGAVESLEGKHALQRDTERFGQSLTVRNLRSSNTGFCMWDSSTRHKYKLEVGGWRAVLEKSGGAGQQ